MMTKTVISEKRWSYVLIDVDGKWVLTLPIRAERLDHQSGHALRHSNMPAMTHC
jgi:hypothetical protein